MINKLISKHNLQLKNQLKIIPMDEKEAWNIYNQMSHIPKIKELFELKRQLSYIAYAESKEESWMGLIQNINEILEAMEEAPGMLQAIAEKDKKPVINEVGYSSVIEGE